ncbi:hypothetical protein [Clostridium sp.]|uniref:hypothetical protein n=1 Tax=Clostridium sp. TaxID=1506 RepID=UPI002847A366|nr:hypothetical protein [Clostridium sp.]MDR3594161.1 hypothetical protein [Clostridium sp.]
MKKNIKRYIVMGIISASIMAVNPIAAHAEWKQDNTGWWYSQGNSYAQSWLQDNNGKWYYFGQDGYMKTGWLNDNGKWYYLNNDGSMAVNTNIGGYQVNNNGVWIQNTTNSNNTTNVNNGSTSSNAGTTAGASATNTDANSNYTNTGNAQTNANNSSATTSTSGNTNQGISDENKLFPCWVLINGKYYYFNENQEIQYNTTIDSYKLGYDGAWIEDDSMQKPNVIHVSTGLWSAMNQVIQKQKFEAEAHQSMVENHQSMNFERQQKINDLQDEINQIKQKTVDDSASQKIQKDEAEIKELQDLIAKDSES